MPTMTAPATVSAAYLAAHPEGTDVREWAVYAAYAAAVSHSLKGANAAARREMFAAWTADAAQLAARWDVENIGEPSNRGVWASAVALSQVLRDLAPGRQGVPFKWAAEVLALLPAMDAEPTTADEDADDVSATPADYARELSRAGYVAGWTYTAEGVELVAFNGATMEVTPDTREDMQDLAIWADSNHTGGYAAVTRKDWMIGLVEDGTLSPAALEMNPWRVADEYNEANALAPNDPDYLLPPSLHAGEFGQWMTEDTREVFREVTSHPAADMGALRAMSRAELFEWSEFVAECLALDPANVCHAQVWGELHNG